MPTTLRGEQIRDGTLVNVDIGAAAAIDWTKISKAGSSLADLITRSAGDLSSGTLADARLSGNVPLLNAANVFTAKQRINHGLGVNRDSASPGEIKTSGGIWERNRTVAMGEWIVPAYAAGDFTANGSMTWTVQIGDVVCYAYTLIGKTMVLAFAVVISSIGGTLNTAVRIAIPGGHLAARGFYGNVQISNATVASTGFIEIVTGGSVVNIYRDASQALNWLASANNTSVLGQIVLEVQ